MNLNKKDKCKLLLKLTSSSGLQSIQAYVDGLGEKQNMELMDLLKDLTSLIPFIRNLVGLRNLGQVFIR